MANHGAEPTKREDERARSQCKASQEPSQLGWIILNAQAARNEVDWQCCRSERACEDELRELRGRVSSGRPE